MLTVAEVKEHLKIDHNADDMLLAGLIKSANNYMISAVDDFEKKMVAAEATDGDTWAPAAKLAQMILIAGWYENRTPVEAGKPTSVTMIITQLQHVNPKGYVA